MYVYHDELCSHRGWSAGGRYLVTMSARIAAVLPEHQKLAEQSISKLPEPYRAR